MSLARKLKDKVSKNKRSDWVFVQSNVKRIFVNGKEILVKQLIKYGDDEVIYEDLQGKIHVIRRKKTPLF